MTTRCTATVACKKALSPDADHDQAMLAMAALQRSHSSVTVIAARRVVRSSAGEAPLATWPSKGYGLLASLITGMVLVPAQSGPTTAIAPVLGQITPRLPADLSAQGVRAEPE